jgi:hypothetical protein
MLMLLYNLYYRMHLAHVAASIAASIYCHSVVCSVTDDARLRHVHLH